SSRRPTKERPMSNDTHGPDAILLPYALMNRSGMYLEKNNALPTWTDNPLRALRFEFQSAVFMSKRYGCRVFDMKDMKHVDIIEGVDHANAPDRSVVTIFKQDGSTEHRVHPDAGFDMNAVVAAME